MREREEERDGGEREGEKKRERSRGRERWGRGEIESQYMVEEGNLRITNLNFM